VIQIQGVWKSFDTLVAVRDVSLQVEQSQTLGLIGPNGSGKTTLLRMISTLAKADRGEIHVCGANAHTEPRDVRRKIAFMPAEFGSPMDMSIYEYMDYFACAVGIPRHGRQDIIGSVLELTDMQGRDEVMVRGLSTGNRQRLLLAKTLLTDPEILILDEPASGLDPRARAEVRALLGELSSMGKTILLSSHILADVEDICTHICILERGANVLAGPLSELREQFDVAHKVIRIKVPHDKFDEAAALLEQLPEVMKCDRVDSLLQVSSHEENSNSILKNLIDADIEILEMAEVRPDLEDIFLDSTKGVVS
jgi:ABC-2 type transport system ATP-binding protein